ncbi:phosphotransferase [Desulfospira joergensenii]|uniref:phosphotransferase n=1 Tax=Desulfospira joergensenii TaxID=53329 RepID=UPI0003B56DA7|nr:phosphotransferase [Desulfospira joergensenii]
MPELSELENPEFIGWIRSQWGISIQTVRTDFQIQGSPERTLSRAVIQDSAGDLYLLEKFHPRKFRVRQNVARGLAFLNQNGLDQALPYRETAKGEFLPFFRENCFQISQFVRGTELERPQYLESSRMGESLARFLIQMKRASTGINALIPVEPFSIQKYIHTLMDRVRVHNPRIHGRYLPFLQFLETRFMDESRTLSPAFCHGDLHPLNVIWNRDRVKAVIDWEFSGFKPDIYDAANLVGCAGIEDPEGLGMPMVMTFIRSLKESAIISAKGWDLFPEYILALRFAWLSEWLRKNDGEMLELEARYMEILTGHMDELKRIWKIG